jgi:molybdopterin-guanine dinucleotide biosynthesis protein A
MSDRPLGAILAGGAGRRMGADKALAELEGLPMIAHVAAALEAARCDVVAVGRTEPVAGIRALPDDAGGQGPAAGLLTALRIASGRPVVLVATDQPMLRPETVTALLQLHGRAVVPMAERTRQVLCAVYREECLEPLTALMTTDPMPSLQRLLDELPFREVLEAEWRGWGEDGRSWRSIDTPDELADLQAGR